jgi:hypothetical protein
VKNGTSIAPFPDLVVVKKLARKKMLAYHMLLIERFGESCREPPKSANAPTPKQGGLNTIEC